jgi:hypothetical protein
MLKFEFLRGLKLDRVTRRLRGKKTINENKKSPEKWPKTYFVDVHEYIFREKVAEKFGLIEKNVKVHI